MSKPGTPAAPSGLTTVPITTLVDEMPVVTAHQSTTEKPIVVKKIVEEKKEKTPTYRKHKATIGIIGHPKRVAELNLLMIQEGNRRGLTLDQHFPEIVAVGIHYSRHKELLSQAQFCSDVGCDVIAIAEEEGNTNTGTKISTALSQEIQSERGGIKIPVHAIKNGKNITDPLQTRLEDLAKTILDEALGIEKPRRPDTYYELDENNEKSTKTGEAAVNANLKLDEEQRNRRIEKRISNGGYTFKHARVNAIVGGAGPAASAHFAVKLFEAGAEFIHFSASSAPGKNDFETGESHYASYVPHYQNAVALFQQLDKNLTIASLTFPCNTIHYRLDEFCGRFKDGDRVFDLRKHALDAHLKEHPGMPLILLGTRMSTGVGLPKGKIGIYQHYVESHEGYKGIQLILPSEEQQQEVMNAIYLVKKGKNKDAQEIIDRVVADIRAEIAKTITYDSVVPAALACTELPVAFKVLELSAYDFIDPGQSIVEAIKEALTPKHPGKSSAKPSPTSAEPDSGYDLTDSGSSTGSDKLSERKHKKSVGIGGEQSDSDSDTDSNSKITKLVEKYEVTVWRSSDGNTCKIWAKDATSGEVAEEFLKGLLKPGIIGQGTSDSYRKNHISFYNLSGIIKTNLNNWLTKESFIFSDTDVDADSLFAAAGSKTAVEKPKASKVATPTKGQTRDS